MSLTVASCAEGDSPPPRDPYPMTLWNRSQFDLLEIRLHPGLSYDDAENILDAELAPEAEISIADFRSTDRVTVIRRKVDVGERFALTTGAGITIGSPGFTLVVFDESFRLLEPDSPNNPFGEPSVP